MPARRDHFDASYQETACLRDGRRVLLRALRPSDRELLRRGFERLSPHTRYLRFFSAHEELTEEKLDSLVSVDGRERFALGARLLGKDGTEGEGVGLARFARVPGRPELAEAAVTVVDEAQGVGLGTLLLQRLTAAALERGIRRFTCEFHISNSYIGALVERLAPGAPVREGTFVRAEVPLPPVGPRDRATSITRATTLFGLLASARGASRPRRRRGPARPPRARKKSAKSAKMKSAGAPRRVRRAGA